MSSDDEHIRYDNPITLLYMEMKKDFRIFKSIGDVEFVIAGDSGMFRMNPSECDDKSFNEFKKMFKRVYTGKTSDMDEEVGNPEILADSPAPEPAIKDPKADEAQALLAKNDLNNKTIGNSDITTFDDPRTLDDPKVKELIKQSKILEPVDIKSTAPMRDENQLHAAIVEIIVKNNAEVKYSTVQNWYPGDENGKGGVLNLVTKRGDLRGVNSKLSWTQVETGSAITWKYPSCILRGDNSVAEFYSVAVTNHYQEADTGTKMIHMGKNTKSTIISKGISAGHSQNSYRGLVRATSNADNARNYSSCDSLLLGSDCGAHTFPYMDSHNDSAVFEHEATTSKISEDQLFYCNQRGIPTEQAVGLIVNGYAKEVLNKLPMEFAVEAQKLLSVSLEGTVG